MPQTYPLESGSDETWEFVVWAFINIGSGFLIGLLISYSGKITCYQSVESD